MEKPVLTTGILLVKRQEDGAPLPQLVQADSRSGQVVADQQSSGREQLHGADPFSIRRRLHHIQCEPVGCAAH